MIDKHKECFRRKDSIIMSNTAIYTETSSPENVAPESKMGESFMREANANKVLNIHTTCDACSARSTNVVFPEGSIEVVLAFCGHHIRKNADALLGQGFSVFPDNYSFD